MEQYQLSIMYKKAPLIWLLICVQALSAQEELRKFNVLLNVSTGSTILPTDGILLSPQKQQPVYTSLSFGMGAMAEYTIANTFGIASGYNVLWQHAEKEKLAVYFLQGDSALNQTITTHRLPILLFYKISPMPWMNKYVKIRAGTSLDWISWGPGYNAPKYQMLGNVITGLYYGYERATGRVLEFGLEYVRSLRSYELRHREATIKNKMDVLSVCFNYYLFKN